MKRIFALVSVLIVASSCFAYYGDYSSSDTSGLLTFIGIVMIIWGILEIILFFKIWGMTNDIKALKKDHFNETIPATKAETAWYLTNNLVLGNIEIVKKTLLKNFIDNVEDEYAKMPKSGCATENNVNWVSLEEENLEKPITPFVDNLTLQYNKIGEEVPIYITRMKTFRDYFNLFVEEDLTVEVKKDE